MKRKFNLALTTGQKFYAYLDGVNNFRIYCMSIIHSFKSLKYLRFRSIYVIIINQTFFTGIKALQIVVIMALIIGGTIIIQAMTNLPKIGSQGYIGNILVLFIVREIGPLATALIVISRSGSAIAAEIATQKQNKEILSMEIMGIDTKLYLVVPRIIASILSIFSLIVIFDIVAFFGGYLISQMTIYIPIDVFVLTLFDAFKMTDMLAAIIKSILFGIIIPLISCYYGFKPKSRFEIPIFVSKAVTRTLFIIFIINIIVSALFYL